MAESGLAMQTFHSDFSNEENGTTMFYKASPSCVPTALSLPPCPTPVSLGSTEHNRDSLF